MDLKELEAGIDPETNWYYQSKLIPLQEYVKKVYRSEGKVNIIDFGAGSGFFSESLLKTQNDMIENVYQVDIGYQEHELGIQTSNPKISRLHFVPEGIENAIVVMMDVLEHLEHDEEMLMDIKNRINHSFRYFITVPAFMSVWSAHDVFLEHYRRYTLKTLGTALSNQGYRIDNRYYLYGTIFPAVWVVRKIKNIIGGIEDPDSSDMKPLPSAVNSFLRGYNSFEMKFRKSNRLFGLSCAAEGFVKG